MEAFKGSNLVIPPFELEPGKEFTVQVDLIDAGNAATVAAANHTLNIKFHPLVVDLEPSEVLAGPGLMLDFEVHIKDFNRHRPESQVRFC